MPNVSASSAARQLLFQWVTAEAPLHLALQATDPAALRLGLQRAATFFHTVRNLRRSADDDANVPRLELLRRSFADVTTADASEKSFVSTTMTLASAIGEQYGGRSYLSLASKLLWTRFRHPFVIYDSVLRSALRTPSGDYPSYIAAWNARYLDEEASISAACQALAASRPPSFRDLQLSTGEAAELLESEWFRRRVLDILLWQRGV